MLNKITFNSISEVLNFIDKHEVTEGYKANMASVEGVYSFTKTNDFNEAMNLLKHGWESGAQKLNTQLKTIKTVDGYKTKQFYGVAGYQCSVPRYLQGIPTNMVNSKRVVTKNKVVNITKDICYNAGWDADKMIEQGVKFVELVNKIESTGTRCNVFVMLGAQRYNNKVCFKIKIKDSSQRMNIKQLAFPLAHPSMLRRILFALMERHETTKDMYNGYGSPISFDELQSEFHKEYFVPREIEEEHITDANKYWCD